MKIDRNTGGSSKLVLTKLRLSYGFSNKRKSNHIKTIKRILIRFPAVALILLLSCSFACGLTPSNSEGLNPLTANKFDLSSAFSENATSFRFWIRGLDKASGQVTLYSGYYEPIQQNWTGPLVWNWGDGNISESESSLGGPSGPWGSHRYNDTSRNYFVTVTGQYGQGKTDSCGILVRFVSPTISPVPLPQNLAVTIPSNSTAVSKVLEQMPWLNITYFDDSFFNYVNRSTAEYILSAAANVEYGLVNGNVPTVDGGFRQILLRDPTPGGIYAYPLWNINPIAFVAADSFLQGYVDWLSLFHEMGHDFTMNTPANFNIGNKTDSFIQESLADIFSMTAAYELMNNRASYGLGDELAQEFWQQTVQDIMWGRFQYENYLNSGLNFSLSDPVKLGYVRSTLVYEFFLNAQKSGLDYGILLSRLMTLLQTFGPSDAANYAQQDSQAAETFRSTFMVAAFSCAFGQDMRPEFRNLNFPINNQTYTQLISRVSLPPLPTPTPTATPLPSTSPTSSPTPPPAIPELPSWGILLPILVATATVLVYVRRRRAD
jgi:hypothetical protein